MLSIEKIRQTATAGALALALGALTVANLLVAPPEVSKSERRPLATRPPVTTQSKTGERVLNTGFMADFETYALDAFIARDRLRALKAFVVFRVFSQLDLHDVYVVGNEAAKIERLDENSVTLAAQKINKLLQLVPDDAQTYYAVVPDKGHYLGAEAGYPGVDYARLDALLAAQISGAQAIGLTGALDAQSYYATDLHWKQTRLSGVLNALGNAMGFSVPMPETYAQQTLRPFYGVYYGQAALPLGADTLIYLQNAQTDALRVAMLSAQTALMQSAPLYDTQAFDGVDPYNVFLSGPQPLVVIENPNAQNGRHLYVYRDSFASSLAPLLCPAYESVTLIDLRYLAAPALEQLVSFHPGADVLFLYSLQILNNSATLMV